MKPERVATGQERFGEHHGLGVSVLDYKLSARHSEHRPAVRVRAIALAAMVIGHVACAGQSPSAPSSAAVPRSLTISGTVRDSAWRPVEGARIAVTVGGDVGTAVVSDTGGQFVLSVSAPASGVFELQASKSGFTSDTKAFEPKDYGSLYSAQPLNTLFQLTETAPLLSLAGRYSAQLVFDPSCGELPSRVRTRSYEAAISAAPDAVADYRIELQGASFINDGNSLDAIVASDFARFFVFPQRASNDEALPFVDMIDADTFLAFAGTATANIAATDTTITARLDGWAAYCPVRPTTNPYSCPTLATGFCRSSTNRLLLTRR